MDAQVPTILAAIAVVDLALMVSAAASLAGDRENAAAYWAAALGVHAAGIVTLATRGVIGDPTGGVAAIAAVLVSVSNVLAYVATRAFFGLPPNRWMMFAPPLLLVLLSAALGAGERSRLIAANAVLLFQLGGTLRAALGGAPGWKSSGRRVFALGLAAAFAVSGARLIAGGIGPDLLSNPLWVSPLQIFNGLAGLVAVVLASTGFLLMAKERSDERLRTAALRDRLTGCWNRIRVEEFARGEMTRLQRHAHPVALLMIDLDLFKSINDRLGHMVGDEVLRTFARIIEGAIRSTDLLGRWGGEEFVLIMPLTGHHEAARVAERLRSALARGDFPQGARVTASFGLAHCRFDDTWEQWIGRADAALYRAKAEGRDRVCSEVDGMGGSLSIRGEIVPQLVWRREYETGDAMEDAQHRAIVAVANELALSGRDDAKAEVHAAMSRLLEHMRTHFDYEERLFAGTDPAAAKRHAETHRRLLARAEALFLRFNAGDLGNAELFHFAIHELVAQHFLIEDRVLFRQAPSDSATDVAGDDARAASST